MTRPARNVKHRLEVIGTLLEWYEAVLNSWHDVRAAGDHGYPRVCPVLNHPSYRELERLLPMLRDHDPVVYWDVAQRYLYAPSKVVLRCSSCGPKPDHPSYGLLHPKDEVMGADRWHNHGRTVVQLRPARVRVPSKAIEPKHLTVGIAWLEENWRGEPFVPDFEARSVA